MSSSSVCVQLFRVSRISMSHMIIKQTTQKKQTICTKSNAHHNAVLLQTKKKITLKKYTHLIDRDDRDDKNQTRSAYTITITVNDYCVQNGSFATDRSTVSGRPEIAKKTKRRLQPTAKNDDKLNQYFELKRHTNVNVTKKNHPSNN